VFGLFGSNGAGKTSVLRVTNGLYKATSGSVEVLGKDPVVSDSSLRRWIGIATAESHFYPELTGQQNLSFFSSFYSDISEEWLEELIRMMGVKKELNLEYSRMSTGIRQKFNIIRAVMHRPKIVFLDEPFANLDQEGVAEVQDIIRILKQQRGAAWINSHDLHYCEDLCDRVGFIFEGRIIDTGRPTELLQKYGSRDLHQLYFHLKGSKPV
jgi:ABC-2 type transport system ATP-binding protein